MCEELPQRRHMRIPDYDYSLCNVYFLTLCTNNRRPLFWAVGATCGRPLERLPLSGAGRIVRAEVERIPLIYPEVQIDNYTIMPDHLHLLVRIESDSCGRPQVAPTVSRIVKQFKGTISKKLGHSVWQKSFYDHIVRNRRDYEECWQYIDNNPLKYR